MSQLRDFLIPPRKGKNGDAMKQDEFLKIRLNRNLKDKLGEYVKRNETNRSKLLKDFIRILVIDKTQPKKQ